MIRSRSLEVPKIATNPIMQKSSEKLESASVRISVVIIAKNAHDTIHYALDSLRNQSRRPDEIIVVLPSIHDNAIELLKEYPEARQVVTGKSSKQTRGGARKLGVQCTTKDIVAFVDADCAAHAGWLEALEKLYLKREEISVQGGTIVGVRDLGHIRMPKDEKLWKEVRFRYVKFLSTANFSFRRKLIDVIGNFDEGLHEGEDLDFCARLLKRKINMVLNPEAMVYTLIKSPSLSIKRATSYGKSRARLLFTHRTYLLSATLVALIHVFLVLVSILAMVFHQYDIFLLGIGLSSIHQLYKWRGLKRHNREALAKTLAKNVVTSYVLYFSFVVHFFYFLLKRTKDAIL